MKSREAVLFRVYSWLSDGSFGKVIKTIARRACFGFEKPLAAADLLCGFMCKPGKGRLARYYAGSAETMNEEEALSFPYRSEFGCAISL